MQTFLCLIANFFDKNVNRCEKNSNVYLNFPFDHWKLNDIHHKAIGWCLNFDPKYLEDTKILKSKSDNLETFFFSYPNSF